MVHRDVKCVRLGLESVEGGCNILRSPDAMWRDFEAERAGRARDLTHFPHGRGIIGIIHNCQLAETGNSLAQ